MPGLTAKKVAALKARGMYGDGDGLYLRIGPTGAKSWILRTAVHGRRRNLGIGSCKLVTLAEARDRARGLRKVAREGGDPSALRRREVPTFEQAARRVHASLLPTWRNAKHGAAWLATVEAHAFPTLGARPVDTIDTADVLAVLAPIWTEKHETATRLRQRLTTIFDWAKNAGYYPRENPLVGVKRALPNMKRRVQHMAALPWRELPGFMAALAERDGTSARTLELLILTAARSSEARGMRWAEVEGDVWTVPAERMKAGKPHRVPLSPEALGVIERMKGLGEELLFPGIQRGQAGRDRCQSENVFRALFARMGRAGMTAHGFRSTFRDWCLESARASRDIAEAALAHATGDATERSYARSDLFERRRVLMAEWGKFVASQVPDVRRGFLAVRSRRSGELTSWAGTALGDQPAAPKH